MCTLTWVSRKWSREPEPVGEKSYGKRAVKIINTQPKIRLSPGHGWVRVAGHDGCFGVAYLGAKWDDNPEFEGLKVASPDV
jgi:hypothetical protein